MLLNYLLIGISMNLTMIIGNVFMPTADSKEYMEVFNELEGVIEPFYFVLNIAVAWPLALAVMIFDGRDNF